MGNGNIAEPVLIVRYPALKTLAAHLLDQPIIAVDTESNSLYAYREQVCLIQFSSGQGDYLVDPLALEDLSPLAPVFSDPRTEKVFHAAEYDLIGLKRDFGFQFRNLFDTMLAARILGRQAIGLGSILAAEFGVQLEKRYQRANWGQRPLPAHLLDYARLDTHYLVSLRNRLRAELQEKQLWDLASEDFRRATQATLNGRVSADRQADLWRISGVYDLDPQQAAVLAELCDYRDKVARSLDRPLFKVFNDHTLLAIASQTPQSLQELSRLPGMSKRQVERYGRALLNLTQRGLQSEPVYPPRSQRPDDTYLERVEALRRWRKSAALEMGVNSDVVMPRELLYAIADKNPVSLDELGEVLQAVPWRLERFGGQILSVLSRL